MCIIEQISSYAPNHLGSSSLGSLQGATSPFGSDTLLAGSVGVVEKEREEFIIHWLLMRRDGVSAHTADIEVIRFPHSPAVKSRRLGFLFLTLPQLKFGPREQLGFSGRFASSQSEPQSEVWMTCSVATERLGSFCEDPQRTVFHTEGKRFNLAHIKWNYTMLPLIQTSCVSSTPPKSFCRSLFKMLKS